VCIVRQHPSVFYCKNCHTYDEAMHFSYSGDCCVCAHCGSTDGTELLTNEYTAGFSILTRSEEEINELVRTDWNEYREQIMHYIDAGWIANGKLTDTGWAMIREADAAVEKNMLVWLREKFTSATDEGHTGPDIELIGTLHITINEGEEIEVLQEACTHWADSYCLEMRADSNEKLCEISVQGLGGFCARYARLNMLTLFDIPDEIARGFLGYKGD